MTYNAGPDAIGHLAYLVTAARPDWDEWVVRSVLLAHALQVDGTDLSIAALRAARDLTLITPKAIGFRGRHWDGLDTKPIEQRPTERCDTCGKIESRCWTERPGPDDHVFRPRR